MHADAARNGNGEDHDGVPVCVNKDVGALVANTGGEFDRRRDDRIEDVVDPASTMLAVLLCQLLLRNIIAVIF